MTEFSSTTKPVQELVEDGDELPQSYIWRSDNTGDYEAIDSSVPLATEIPVVDVSLLVSSSSAMDPELLKLRSALTLGVASRMSKNSHPYARKMKPIKQSLDLRFPSTPHCSCNMKAEIRTVESLRKPSLGKLYYCCRFRTCNFFRWAEPTNALWVPSGIPVTFFYGNSTVEENYAMPEPENYEDNVGEEEVISMMSDVGTPKKTVWKTKHHSINPWCVVSGVLLFVVLFVLMYK